MTRTSPRKWTAFSVLLALLLLDGLGILLRPAAPPAAAAPPPQTRIALYRPPPLPPKRPKAPKPKPAPPGPKAHKKTAAAPAKRARTPKRARPAHTAPPGTGAPVLSLVRTETPARKTTSAPLVSVVQGNVTLPAAPLSAPSTVTTADVPQFSPTAGAGGVASGPGGGGADAGAGSGGSTGKGGSGGAGGEPFGAGSGGGGGGGPRHVVYVLDISLSMQSRISRARQELLNALDGLGEGESFDIILFGGDVHPFDRELVPASASTRAQARYFLSTSLLIEGTNLDAALTFALSVPGVNEVFVITDGDPTEGETDWDALTRRVRRLNTAHARIDTVGLVGRDPEGRDKTFEGTRLLSRLSADSGGQFRRVSLGVAE